MTKEDLHALAREVYGFDKWASTLAADLTASGRQTAPATVNHWQSGERPPADWLPDALVIAWHARALRLRHAALRAREVADRLSATLAPDIDEDLAPRM